MLLEKVDLAPVVTGLLPKTIVSMTIQSPHFRILRPFGLQQFIQVIRRDHVVILGVNEKDGSINSGNVFHGTGPSKIPPRDPT